MEKPRLDAIARDGLERLTAIIPLAARQAALPPALCWPAWTATTW